MSTSHRLLATTPSVRHWLLRAAPELAGLALLDVALTLAVDALCAEHPTLVQPTEPNEPSSLRSARSLLVGAQRLQLSLARYDLAVRDAVGATSPADESGPF
jgi:hypothetical protein